MAPCLSVYLYAANKCIVEKDHLYLAQIRTKPFATQAKSHCPMRSWLFVLIKANHSHL